MPVSCKICNQEFKNMITNTHLKKHNISIQEYADLYGKDALTSVEYRKERSIANSGKNNPNFGNKMSDESKKSISEKNKGKIPHNKGVPMPEELKANLREKARIRNENYKKNNNHPRLSKSHSKATRNLLSKRQRDYAEANPEIMSQRAYKSIETKKKKGIDLAFFRGKHHTQESITKIIQSSKEIRKQQRNKTNQWYLNKINDSNLTLIGDIEDHPLHLKCNICGYEFTRTRQVFQQSKRNGNEICDYCYPKGTGPSKQELEILEFIKSELPNVEILSNNRTILKNCQELDIVIPTLNLAFEYNGLYPHSEANGIDKNYHLIKTKLAAKAGYTLIHIFSDEWLFKREIVESRIRSLLGTITNKIYARKCTVKEISSKEVNSFLNKNHIQGSGRSNIRLGLFYKDELVSVMTFTNSNISRKQKKDIFELNRFCSKLNHSIIGGASKLFSYFIRNFKPTHIISYADKRWSNGKVYENLGFVKENDTEPGYWYTDGAIRIHRFTLRKNKNDDPNLTEVENRIQQGWNRIWDCGHLKYKWES